jgi:penicillin-binding protein 1C
VARSDLAEALTLAVIPQNPARRAGRSEPQEALLAARTQLGAMWLDSRAGSETVDSERRQIEIPLVTNSRFAMPFEAPHFVDAILAARRNGSGSVETTLDAGLQHLVERQIDRYLSQYGSRGIQNVSALLVDTRDMAVKAWVGSADYWNKAIDGQVNGVLAKRSPGSTLKPFIYALGLDQGVLHPRTMLRDAPTAFGPFSPENFDGQFFGPVSAEEALIRSRNVPAMVVASQLKQPNLYQFLKSAGVSRMRPEAHYGLALVLGGGEVTMEELAEMYAMLANRGVLRRLRMTSTIAADQGVQLLSPEATFITLDMLTKNPRPDEDGATPRRSRWPVAWKTGTSWGFRDAWSAGVAGPYVLVVWIGNFRGEGNPSFIGVDAAAPLFFRIVDALNFDRSGEPVPPPAPPKGVSRVAVCAASGDLPNAWCPQTVDTWYIPGKSPIRVSQLHRPVALDPQSGRAICPPYPANTRFEVFELWPSDMLKLFREAGMPRRIPPAVPDCAQDDPADAPRIASPLRGVIYTLHRNAAKEFIELEAGAAGDVRTLFWFDGRSLIGRTAPQRPLQWRPDADGIHLLRVIDDHGRAAEREVHVQFAR